MSGLGGPGRTPFGGPPMPPRQSQGGRGGFAGSGRPQQDYQEKPSRIVPLRVEKVTDKSLQARLIYGNLCAVSDQDFRPTNEDGHLYILIRGGQPAGQYVVTAQPIRGFPQGCISLTDPQRTWCNIAIRDNFTGEEYDPFRAGGKAYLGSLDVEIGFASPNKRTEVPYDEDELSKIFTQNFQNQVLAPGQRILMDIRNVPLLIIVKTVGLVDLAMATDDQDQPVHREGHARGILTSQTKVSFHRDGKGDFNLKPSMTKPNSNAILAPDFKFEDMGIGGLENEFSTIFRRAFASRIFPAGMVSNMGIPHVKGMLLYGPPGTGKTLIARQIGKMLNARPPKVINGPEVLNKYVGQSEENIRKLFADAEKEYKEKGDESSLHIIIFDELDAVCKQRGSGAGGGTGVGDSVVNQLLSKLDGVDQLNNILLIGMTNRKDMIDDALLRPGRLEVHLEITLPDENGRLEIFKIHTAKIRDNGYLDPTVNMKELASMSKNYSGAEISGVVKAAVSRAFMRHTVVDSLAKVKEDVTNLKVNYDDFMHALTEIRPAFGVSEADLEEAVSLGIFEYSHHVNESIQSMMRLINTIRNDPKKTSTTVLFHGPDASGKTALAAHIALKSDFPFAKMVTPTDLVGYRDDFAKKDYVHKAFADAYKSPASVLILDDFENLIGWNQIGPRFSTTMLEALTTLIASKPPKGHRLLVLITTSKASVINQLGIEKVFKRRVAVPALSNCRELGAALEASKSLSKLSSSDIQQVCQIVQERTGSNSLMIGIKDVLDRVFDANGGGQGLDVVTTLGELLVEKIMELGG